MDKFRFVDTWDEIAGGRDKMFPGTTKTMFADAMRKFLKRKLGSSNKDSA